MNQITQGVIDARRAILNSCLYLLKQKQISQDEFDRALQWFHDNAIPVAIMNQSGRYEQCLTWPEKVQ